MVELGFYTRSGSSLKLFLQLKRAEDILTNIKAYFSNTETFRIIVSPLFRNFIKYSSNLQVWRQISVLLLPECCMVFQAGHWFDCN